MVKKFNVPDFKRWEDAHVENMSLPFITESALIKLSELEVFLNHVKSLAGADSVRISFLRFNVDDNINIPQEKKDWADERVPEGCKWIEAGQGLTQVAVALVPTKNLQFDLQLIASADNITEENNSKILILIPGGEKDGPTGHNPPSNAKDNASGAGN